MPRQRRLNPDGLDGLAAGLAVLETFRAEAPELSLAVVSQRLGLSKSRAFRILHTLKARGFVEQAVRGGPYRLGPRIAEVAHAVGGGRSLLAVAAPVLAELARVLRGTVVLRVLDGTEQLTLDCVHSPEVLRTAFPVGARFPATYGSTGKALLAFRPVAVRAGILARVRLTGGGPRAFTRMVDFRRELDRVRAAGFALNLEEAVAGVRGVAAPVLDQDGSAVAAIAISFPASALPKSRVRAVAARVRQGAHDISVRLGHAQPQFSVSGPRLRSRAGADAR